MMLYGERYTQEALTIMCGRRKLQKVGSGAFGQVYQAQNLTAGNMEVVKIVAKSKAAAKEAIILARIPAHVNMIQQFFFRSSKNTIYMFLQHGRPHNLYQFVEMQQFGRLELRGALGLYRDVVAYFIFTIPACATLTSSQKT